MVDKSPLPPDSNRGGSVVGSGLIAHIYVDLRRHRLRLARQLGRWNEKRGVVHAERLKNASSENVAQFPTRNHLDDAAEHVGRDAVFPNLSRLMYAAAGRRAPPYAPPAFCPGSDVRGRDQLLHLRVSGESVSQSGRVTHQILDRDWPLERNEIEPVAVLHPDLRLREGGDIFGQGIRDQHPPLLDQHHRRHRDDRLGHRIDSEDRVGRHRRPVRPEGAQRPGEADFAVARDQHRKSWRPSGCDLALHDRRQALEPGARKADFVGLGRRQTGKCPGERVGHGVLRWRPARFQK